MPCPLGASVSVVGDPPCTPIFFNLPPATKAMNAPSGDQDGGQNTNAPSVPARGTASNELNARIQMLVPRPAPVAMNASRVPSGESANAGVRSFAPPPN